MAEIKWSRDAKKLANKIAKTIAKTLEIEAPSRAKSLVNISHVMESFETSVRDILMSQGREIQIWDNKRTATCSLTGGEWTPMAIETTNCIRQCINTNIYSLAEENAGSDQSRNVESIHVVYAFKECADWYLKTFLARVPK